MKAIPFVGRADMGSGEGYIQFASIAMLELLLNILFI
jgi:hypothetical protein